MLAMHGEISGKGNKRLAIAGQTTCTPVCMVAMVMRLDDAHVNYGGGGGAGYSIDTKNMHQTCTYACQNQVFKKEESSF